MWLPCELLYTCYVRTYLLTYDSLGHTHRLPKRHLERFIRFYRAMLCIRGTSHGPVSVSVSVCHKPVFY